MTEVAILGAGSGGLAAAADLAFRGHQVRLYNRSDGALEPIRAQGGIRASGAAGEGMAELPKVTTSLDDAIDGADAIVVVLPATAHAAIARAIGRRNQRAPLVLNPGHMCGSLHVRRVLEAEGQRRTIVDLGTLTYVSRSLAPGSVDVYLRATGIPLAVTPDDEDAARLADDLFPGQRRAAHAMEAWFWDVNMVLHPPGMIVGAARIESTGGDFNFYGDGITPAVEAVMRSLDGERVAVARAFGVDVPDLAETMASIGTADPDAAHAGRLGDAIRGGAANASIKAPPRLDHRYLHEDVPYGLVPLAALGRVARVPTPVTDSLVRLAETVAGREYEIDGLNEDVLGINGAGIDDVVAIAGGRA